MKNNFLINASKHLLTNMKLIYIKTLWIIQMNYHLYIGRRNVKVNINDLDILYENDNIIVLSKAPDLIINHRNSMFMLTLANQLYYKRYWKSDESTFYKFRFCHQLDYATSGIICIGYNSKGAGKVSKCFQNRTAKKQYLAIVRGHIETEKLRNYNNLVNIISKNNTNIIRVTDGIGFKRCSTNGKQTIQCLSSDNDSIKSQNAQTDILILSHGFYHGLPATKLLLIPYTGRTHQLRVHCALSLKAPIVGDCMYGEKLLEQYGIVDGIDECLEPPRMMLHAFQLKLPAHSLQKSMEYSEETVVFKDNDPFQTQYDYRWQEQIIFNTPDCYFQDE